MNPFTIMLAVLFEPAEGFRLIQRDREKFNYAVPVLLLLCVLAVRIGSIFFTHYPLATVDPAETNIGTELLNVIIPILTWVVGCYLVTTIHDGESMLREVFAAAAYSMLPYIIITIPVVLLSNMMSITDMTLYSRLQYIIWGWVILLFLISLSSMNSYSFWETIKIAVISIFACIFIWAVIGLMYVLGDKLVAFFVKVIEQYRMLLFS